MTTATVEQHAAQTTDTASKLPALTVLFWVMKIAATTLGETAGDLLSMTLKAGYAVSSLILISAFFAALSAQLRAKSYVPVLYWSVILATSTAGTTMSDFMDRSLGLGYAKGTSILLTLLALIFLFWRSTGESFAVDKIRSRRVEALYWTAILFSNTLGTALADYLAHNSGLGFARGGLLIGALLIVTIFVSKFTAVSKVLLFWIAFVLTRPFGATIGDVLTKTRAEGGLGFGTVGSSAILGSVLVSLVVYATLTSKLKAPDTVTTVDG